MGNNFIGFLVQIALIKGRNILNYFFEGMSHNSLRMTLETIIMQPGIRPELVFVCLDEKLEEQASLVDLFGFQYVKLKSSYNYTEIFHKALTKVWSPDIIEKVSFT